MNYMVIKGVVKGTPKVETYKAGENETAYCNFTVMVKRSNNQQNYDLIDCCAYRQQAHFLAKYFPDETPIIVEGSMRTKIITTADDVKIKKYCLYADNIHFAENKKKGENESETKPVDFMSFIDENGDLPF